MSDNFETPRFVDDDEPESTPPPYVPQFLTPRNDTSIDSIPDGTQAASPIVPDEEEIAAPEELPEPEPNRTPIGAENQPKAPPPEEQSTFVNPALARVSAARPRPEPREVGEVWLAFRTMVIVVFAALIVAFIFSYWTPESFLSDEFRGELQAVNSTRGGATALPSPLPTFSSVQR
ncbi:MAG: hypothetical protein K8I82_21035, partial [Anaerolineae bacterium]|nr:hypothetical protein [Anaerolineae bacterium]